MAKRRSNNDEAVSLFPFMSILACLIGILTLMISVSMQLKQSESQSQGLTEEEKSLAEENRALKAKAEAIVAATKHAEEKLKKDNHTSAQLAELKDRKIVLQEELRELSRAKDPQSTDAALQKMVELLHKEITTLKNGRPALVKKLEGLKAELAKRKTPPKKVESVVVRPGGSGVRMAARLFFVECNSTGLVLIDERGTETSVATATIGSSTAYRSFLQQVKDARDAMVLFLIRKEGASAYNEAAVLAENNFEIRTGKLPIPNNGPIDLSLFRK